MTASSGTKKYTKMVIIVTNPAKKKKRPNFKWQSMERKACAMIKVKNMLTDTLTACPADLTSRGQISLGTSHPNGPHDHAKAATYAQMKNSNRSASVFVKDPSPVTPNFSPIIAPTATCAISDRYTGTDCDTYEKTNYLISKPNTNTEH